MRPFTSSARHPALVVLSLSLLVGCAVLPQPNDEEVRDQALGHVVIPPNWSAQAGAEQVEEGWLATFNDATLSQLVFEALANNPDLQMAAARVGQANAHLEIAQAQLKPALGMLGRAGTKPVTDLVPLLSGVMVRLSWEIDLWGRMRYARDAAHASHDATSADYRYAQQSLAASVARIWFVANETKLQLALAHQMSNSADRLRTLSEQRARVGVGTLSDVLAARRDLSTYQDAQQQVELAHHQALRSLELLLGRYPEAALAMGDTMTPFPAPVPVGIPADVLNRRPDLIAAERRVAAAFSMIGEAKAAMLPTLSLSAGYGRISNEAVLLRENLEQTTASSSLTAIAPIYTGGALTGKVQLRSAEQNEAVADYARRALIALGEVEDALNAERILAERERILGEAAQANRLDAMLEERSYSIGKSDLRAVSQRHLATWASEAALLAVRRERLSRRVDLYLALGGGFDESQPISTLSRQSR